jgi:hypothetical protein
MDNVHDYGIAKEDTGEISDDLWINGEPVELQGGPIGAVPEPFRTSLWEILRAHMYMMTFEADGAVERWGGKQSGVRMSSA